MRIAAATLLALGALVGCGTTPTVSRTATSARSVVSTEAPAPTASPSTSPQLSCGKPVVASHGLALITYRGSSALGILDVSDPVKPSLLCWLSPADGGRFDQSAGHVIFWSGNKLGSANLATGNVVVTDQLPATPFFGAFSADATMFAYRVGDDNIGVSTHLYASGHDRTLYTQEPIGGHGGPTYGPLDQLEFSADGSDLLDFYEFRPTTGPPKMLIFQTADWSILFKSASAPAGGVWSPTGSTPYFFLWGPQPSGSAPATGDLDTLDQSGQLSTVASNLSGFFWPRMTPDGRGIVYDTYDAAGQPHIWRIDLRAHATSQLSAATGSRPVYLSPTVIWFNEEKPCECGPGGLSATDGVVLAYNFVVGGWTVVDMSQTVPGVGAPQPNTGDVIDVRL